MGSSMSVCTVFYRIVTTMTLDHIVASITSDTIVVFDIIVEFLMSAVALLTSSPVMWRKEHIWNFSVLQRVLCINYPIIQYYAV
jgi:hypothetical protein